MAVVSQDRFHCTMMYIHVACVVLHGVTLYIFVTLDLPYTNINNTQMYTYIYRKLNPHRAWLQSTVYIVPSLYGHQAIWPIIVATLER